VCIGWFGVVAGRALFDGLATYMSLLLWSSTSRVGPTAVWNTEAHAMGRRGVLHRGWLALGGRRAPRLGPGADRARGAPTQWRYLLQSRADDRLQIRLSEHHSLQAANNQGMNQVFEQSRLRRW
jgi:hypothetical protein